MSTVAVIRGAADELLGRGSLAVVSHEVAAHPRLGGAVCVQGNSSSGLPPRRDWRRRCSPDPLDAGCGEIYRVPTLRIAQDPAADDLLGRDPLALLIGMLLDQHMRPTKQWSGRSSLRAY